MLRIKSILENSLCDKCGITDKMHVKSVNNFPVVDTLDILFAESLENILITTVSCHGEEKKYRIKNDFVTPLGLEVDEAECLEPYQCKNNCLFCFVKQLPKGMRETLYIKDDDYRHSMISGSYVTLTNLSESDIERIIRLRISPLYISVHAYDDNTRIKLLANKKAKNTISVMKKLLDAGILMHTQIVVCEGINDGKILEDTINHLYSLSENILSCAVIPVGLTKYRDGLPILYKISKTNANTIIEFTEKANAKYADRNNGFVWASDEMYLIADRKIPCSEYYGDYSQISNGVGLLAQFDDEFNESLQELEENNFKDLIETIEKYNKWQKIQEHYKIVTNSIDIADEKLTKVAEETKEFGEYEQIVPPYALITGVSFAPILKKYAKMLEHLTHIGCNVYAIVNEFFGESVTVAGLITGGDIIKQLKGKIKESRMIIPSVMLREFTTTFLDGMTIEDIEKELDVHIYISKDASDLVSIITSDAFDYGEYIETEHK